MSDTILILESRQFDRQLLTSYLTGQGFQVLAAGSGAEGLRLMGVNDVRVLITDIKLPGMSGLDFMQHLRQLGKMTAAIMLADGYDKDTVIRAARLRIRDLLVKGNLTCDALVERIRKRLAEATQAAAAPVSPPVAAPPAKPVAVAPILVMPDAPHVAPRQAAAARPKAPAPAAPRAADLSAIPVLLTREKTLKRLEEVAGGKTMAGVVAQVIALASSPDADIADIVRVIESDPILAARVLQLANSAAAGARHRSSNIEEAARSVGLRGIQNMGVSIGIFGTFPPDEADGFNSMRCWQHSFAVAEFMGMIVRERNPEREGVNHLVGLCHELGELLLRQHFTEEYDQILAIARERQMPVQQVASTALGVRHPELVSRLLVRIGLPPHVCDAIREFHERQIREQAAGMSPQAQLLQLANTVAHGLLLSPSTHETVRPISRIEWRNLSPDHAPPKIDPVSKHNEIVVATNILARLPAHLEARLLKPLLASVPVRIGYVRPASFIELDPVAFALAQMATCEVLPEFPSASQIEELDGLVVTGIRAGVVPVLPEEFTRLKSKAGRPAFPILALTGDKPPTANNDEHTLWKTYPISLDDLHAWLTSVLAAKPQAVAAAS